MGPNGAGKSTLVRALAGLLPARRRGEVHVDGRPLARLAARRAGAARWRWSTSEEEGPDALAVEDRVRAGPLPAPRAVPPPGRARTTRRLRARSTSAGIAPPAPAAAGHALRRRAPARRAGARPGAAAADPAARRAGRAPRHRPPAPPVPRARRACGPAAWACSRWRTTCRGRRPGPSRMVLLAGGRVAARARPTRCWRARPARRPSASRSAATRVRRPRRILSIGSRSAR